MTGEQFQDNSSLGLSKYQNLDCLPISRFISSIPSTLSDALHKIRTDLVSYSSSNDFIVNNRIKLQKHVRNFHSEAGTMAPGIEENIALLENPVTRIFASLHQPNLFAYGGVFKKIVLLRTLKDRTEKEYGKDNAGQIVTLFVVADHDFVNETWIHLAQIPSVRHSLGKLELRFPVDSSRQWNMVRNIPKPTRTLIEQWREQVLWWIIKSSSLNKDTKSLMVENFMQFWKEVKVSFSKAKSYSDFNSFLMSRIVNTVWGYNTLFVRITDMSLALEGGFRYLTSNYKTYSDSLRRAESLFLNHNIDPGISSSTYLYAPVWVHCTCGSKASVRIVERRQGPQNKLMVLEGTCISCGRLLELNLGSKDKLELLKEEAVLDRLSPRAIPILILLSRELGIQCYASGSGGVGYTVAGSLAFDRLSVNMPLIIFWPSSDDYFGLGQAEALELIQAKGKSDVDSFLETLIQKEAEYAAIIKPMLEERDIRIKAGESIDMLLSNLIHIKEEQRNLRRLIKLGVKVKNAVSMAPCFIDYVVNFGMINTEAQWRTHILKNGSLSAPIRMTTMIHDTTKY